ncbi:MAG: hypothetical protein PHY47_16075 [Lachnospiraceae bacterium]|nr:hypothetical protein [Lachnospiraceae bacterium]
MLKEIIISILTALIITLILIIARQLVAILNAFLEKKKAEATEANNKSAATAYSLAITVLNSITETTVSQIEATQAAAVRKAVKSGQKEFTELTKLSDDAYLDIVDQMSPIVMEALESCVGNTETLIRNKIEEVLPEVKTKYSALTSSGEVIPAQGEQQDGEKTES